MKPIRLVSTICVWGSDQELTLPLFPHSSPFLNIALAIWFEQGTSCLIWFFGSVSLCTSQVTPTLCHAQVGAHVPAGAAAHAMVHGHDQSGPVLPSSLPPAAGLPPGRVMRICAALPVFLLHLGVLKGCLRGTQCITYIWYEDGSAGRAHNGCCVVWGRGSPSGENTDARRSSFSKSTEAWLLPTF